MFFEKAAVRLLDKIVLAEDGYRDYVNENYPLRMNKFVVLRNFSIISLIDSVKIRLGHQRNTIVIYAGGLTKIRGIREIIEAINQLDNIEFWLLGSWENEQYERECNLSDIKNKVNYIGYVKMEEVYPYMKEADIGIANLYPEPNYLTSLPVKAFEYMACKLPIVMSNFEYWKEVFAGCAVFTDPHDPDQIAEKIRFLIDNPEESEKMAARGLALVQNKYSWETEENVLIEMYDDMLKKR